MKYFVGILASSSIALTFLKKRAFLISQPFGLKPLRPIPDNTKARFWWSGWLQRSPALFCFSSFNIGLLVVSPLAQRNPKGF